MSRIYMGTHSINPYAILTSIDITRSTDKWITQFVKRFGMIEQFGFHFWN